MHIPVLLNEVMEYLDIKSGEKYIDATFGAGGHSKKIAEAGGIVLGIDRDPEALKSNNSINIQRVAGNFSKLREIAMENGFSEVSGILFDLGMGSHQLDDPKRGFSFQKKGPLDMRYNRPSSAFSSASTGEGGRGPGEGEKTAADILNNYSETILRQIFERYGEEKRFGRKIARAIINRRKQSSLQTTDELFELIKEALPGKLRFKAGDAARRIFQSLRIAVNDELTEIEKALPQAVQLLRPGGRLVVISFHSLEDRIVKRFMLSEAKECACPPEIPVCACDKVATLKILTRKPQAAAEEEISANPRSRSAKLRAAEKKKISD